jgi:hypothetical protein
LVHIDREHASCLQQVFDPPLSRRTVAPHTAQASAAGEKSSAARSTRSWFRLTGGFRHPSLFSLRRLTSPSVEASNSIAPLRPAGSLPPFGLGIPALAALSPPLQRSLRFLRHPPGRRMKSRRFYFGKTLKSVTNFLPGTPALDHRQTGESLEGAQAVPIIREWR